MVILPIYKNVTIGYNITVGYKSTLLKNLYSKEKVKKPAYVGVKRRKSVKTIKTVTSRRKNSSG